MIMRTIRPFSTYTYSYNRLLYFLSEFAVSVNSLNFPFLDYKTVVIHTVFKSSLYSVAPFIINSNNFNQVLYFQALYTYVLSSATNILAQYIIFNSLSSLISLTYSFAVLLFSHSHPNFLRNKLRAAYVSTVHCLLFILLFILSTSLYTSFNSFGYLLLLVVFLGFTLFTIFFLKYLHYRAHILYCSNPLIISTIISSIFINWIALIMKMFSLHSGTILHYQAVKIHLRV